MHLRLTRFTPTIQIEKFIEFACISLPLSELGNISGKHIVILITGGEKMGVSGA